MEDVESRHHPTEEDIFEVVTFKLWVLDMILFHGIMHGDIHYGNWGIGREFLVIYDWGVVYEDPRLNDLVFSFVDRNEEMLMSSLLGFFPAIDLLRMMDWLYEWEQDDYQLTQRMTGLLINIVHPHFRMTQETLMFLNFINFFSMMDQYAFLKETDLMEVRKFQLALLRSKEVLPDMQNYLEQKIFS
jgi:predicted unusual protein kinase regulating ubiquinone biosynthesis (AarF/ABC1/UbiB family)